MFRKTLMMGVAGAAFILTLGAGSALAQSNVVHPHRGNITPFYGNITPFRGNITPFWGNIDPFWGNISPFRGNISPFWGNITPFRGNITPFYETIQPFWDQASPLMEQLRGNWANYNGSTSSADLLRNNFQQLITQSGSFWGASVTAQTGLSFQDGFVTPLLNKHGVNLNNPASFAGFTDAQRAAFLFAWYDGLMGFSGRDRVDYWMSTVRWNPALAQVQGGGQGVVIGMFDFTPTGANLTNLKEWKYEGHGTMGQGHGAAVASLLVSDYDGVGMMGLAPNAVVAGYNPFDQSGTASWAEISEGIFRLKKSGASVVNMSLGEPGRTFSPEWVNIYTASNVKNKINDVVFVHAAGNEGVAQTQNIAWNFSIDPTVLVVGSAGPNGVISDFSNRPGTACLTDNGVCRDMLMNRFLVAPGEWILVSDGAGGVTRQSGTSFAAPQVTGAIALLQGRWSWLKSYPRETADIVLLTAKDLGAPGVDAVYGRGLLDITAAQSPINAANLYQRTANGTRVPLVAGGGAPLLGATDGYVTVFEDVGATYRDFLIPLNATLTTGNASNGRALQGYLLNSLQGLGAPVATTTTTTTTKPKKKFGDDFFAVANPFGWDMRVNLSSLPNGAQAHDGELPYAFDVAVSGKDGVALFGGRGYGARALSGLADFSASSFVAADGGANPVLGFASGGAYIASEIQLGGGVSMRAGFTERQSQAFEPDAVSGEERAIYKGLSPYTASAAHVSLRNELGQNLAVTAAYTYLDEKSGLLGVQSFNPADFAAGAQSDAATFGAEWSPTARIGFAASATLSRTRGQSSADQALAVSGSGINASAFEVDMRVNGVFGRSDLARLRLAHPLHVEAGGLDVTNVEVIDRATGELGTVTHRVDLNGGARQYILEGSYVTSILGGRGELAALARVDASDAGAAPIEQVIGGRIRFAF